MVNTTAVDELFARNGQPDDLEPWITPDEVPTISMTEGDTIAICADGAAWWINSDRCWVEVTPSNLSRVIDRMIDQQADLVAVMCRIWEEVDVTSLPDGMICERTIQHDPSGQGHHWRTIYAASLPEDIAEEIECEILDGPPKSAADYVAQNGLHYRWM